MNRIRETQDPGGGIAASVDENDRTPGYGRIRPSTKDWLPCVRIDLAFAQSVFAIRRSSESLSHRARLAACSYVLSTNARIAASGSLDVRTAL